MGLVGIGAVVAVVKSTSDSALAELIRIRRFVESNNGLLEDLVTIGRDNNRLLRELLHDGEVVPAAVANQ